LDDIKDFIKQLTSARSSWANTMKTKGCHGILAEIKETDTDEHVRYRNAVNQLIGKMSERL
jgi:hypothetical protein